MSSSNFDRLNRRMQLDPEDHLQRLQALNARARIEGSGVFLEVLEDRRVWNGMPSSVQDMAIQEVGRRVQGGFTYLKTEVYSCGGQRHRIASFEHKKTGLVLNLIPGGKYLRGSGSASAYSFDEEPVKEVRIPAFFVGQTPVTQKAWDQIDGEDRRAWYGERWPIERCSWEACDKWLSKAEGGLRMLSESEWEYACRAGTTTDYCFGDDSESLEKYAWYWENSNDKTRPVGEKPPNAFGLYDMHGNVFEWCADWYVEGYSTVQATHLPHSTPASDDVKHGKYGGSRVNRGGGWYCAKRNCRSASRNWDFPFDRSNFLGLRVARDLNATI